VLAGQTLTQISGSDSGGCALSGTGQAYCWGQNYDGQLGDGSTAPSDLPVVVDASGALAGQTLTQISYGGTYACALDSGGAAYCWGLNIYGGLGDGNDNGSLLPVPVRTDGALAGQALAQISAGYETTCAVSRAGGAYCWGSNEFDLLGDPSIDGGYYSSGIPVPVAVAGPGRRAGPGQRHRRGRRHQRHGLLDGAGRTGRRHPAWLYRHGRPGRRGVHHQGDDLHDHRPVDRNQLSHHRRRPHERR
jgi:hypothetical protein